MLMFEDRIQLKALGAWFIATLITLSVYLGGIADQLRFGSRICLLYVENYHLDPIIKSYVFQAYSPTCDISVSFGSLGFVVLFGVIGVRLFFMYKNEEPSRNVYLGLAAIASAWTALSLIMAIILNIGLSRTCSEFEKSGKSCGAVFGEGFFEGDTKNVYYKNINTINAALSSAWILVLFWASYAAFEIHSYRTSSLKWW